MKHLLLLMSLLVPMVLTAESVPVLEKEFASPAMGTRIRGISPDGKYALLTGQAGARFFILDLVSQRIVQTIVFQQGTTHMLPALFSPDSQQLLIGHQDGFIEEISITTGVRNSQSYAAEPIITLAVVETPHRETLLLVGSEAATNIWNYFTRVRLHSFSGVLPPINYYAARAKTTSALHPDGTHALVSDENGVHLFDLTQSVKAGTYLSHCTYNGFNLHVIRADFISRSFLTLGVLAKVDTKAVWLAYRMPDGGPEWVLHTEDAYYLDSDSVSTSPTGRVLLPPLFSYELSRSPKRCALSLRLNTATDVVAEELVRAVTGETSLAMTPDGKTAVLASDGDNLIQVWSLP